MWLLPIKDRLSNIKNNYYARRGFKEEVLWLRLKGDERTHEQCQYKDLDNKPLYLTRRVSVGQILRLSTLKKFHINERRSGNKQKNIGCFKMSLASSNYSDCLSRILYTEYLKPGFFFYSIAKGVASLKISICFITHFFHINWFFTPKPLTNCGNNKHLGIGEKQKTATVKVCAR